MVQQHPTSSALIEVLIQARVAAGMSQRDLAAKLRWPQSRIGKIESAARNISVIEFVEIARALGIDPSKLLTLVVKATGL